MKEKKLLIRNSTAEFLIFTGQAGGQSIEARYEDETIWLTQKLMSTLFEKKSRRRDYSNSNWTSDTPENTSYQCWDSPPAS